MPHDEDVLESGEPIRAQDTMTKWVVGLVGSAVVAALAWFATADRKSVEDRLEMQRLFASQTTGTLAVHEYRLDEQRERLSRIDEKLDKILERLPPKGSR